MPRAWLLAIVAAILVACTHRHGQIVGPTCAEWEEAGNPPVPACQHDASATPCAADAGEVCLTDASIHYVEGISWSASPRLEMQGAPIDGGCAAITIQWGDGGVFVDPCGATTACDRGCVGFAQDEVGRSSYQIDYWRLFAKVETCLRTCMASAGPPVRWQP
jgi:hypothetical protein